MIKVLKFNNLIMFYGVIDLNISFRKVNIKLNKISIIIIGAKFLGLSIWSLR